MSQFQLDEEAIFDLARQIESPDAQAQYLDQACGGDPTLKDRVVELLENHHTEGSFLERPPEELAQTIDLPSASERAGDTIGPYKLLQKIGEGGFGVVYMAEQHRPIRRKVALKVIKPGMDTKEVIGRFEAERQALAMMDHPNIAKVLDAGATDSSRPYFVMELVRGIPITEYCDKERMGTRERLGLFAKVCQAVQHAHQKGVIHRDIKPSNVLITEHDGSPVPKVIDFGVAKAINQQLTEHTVFTRFQQMIGTPMYMSPEQAALSGLDIDTRSDIYSLGVLLYELLTGSTPFDKQKFKQAAYEEIRRIIREEEPPKPSTKISTMGDESAQVAGSRKSDIRKLRQVMRGELDWIVMKALEKDRKRRYETANGFAMDVQRYLDGDAVQACPPSAAYRLRKFAHRNKAAFATGALVSLSLLVGLIGMSVQTMRATRESERAKLAEAEAESQAKRAQREAEMARRKGSEAAEKSRELEHQLNVSRVAQLSAQSESVRQWSPGRSVQLAVEAVNKSRDLGEKSTSLAHETLLAATSSMGGFPLPAKRNRTPGRQLSETSPNSRWLLAFGNGAYLCDLNSDNPTKSPAELKGHEGRLLSASFSPDSMRLLTGCADGLARFFDLSRVEPAESHVFALEHSSGVSAVSFSSDGTQLITGSEEGAIHIWDLQGTHAATQSTVLRADGIKITGIELSPDGHWLLSRRAGGTARLWNLRDFKPSPELPAKNGLSFSSDGRWLATANWKEVQLFDLEAADPIESRITLSGHENKIHNMSISPDCRWLATASWDGKGRLWRLDATDPASTVIEFDGHSGRVWALGFSSDSSRLITADSKSPYAGHVWDLTASDPSQTPVLLRGHSNSITSARFIPESHWVVTVSRDKTARLWDTEASDPSGSSLVLSGHNAVVYSPQVSPDGNWLVTTSQGIRRLWNISEDARAPSPVMLDGDGPLVSQGRYLITESDVDLRVTDLRQKDPAYGSIKLKGHSEVITAKAMSRNGRWLISGSTDHTARVWDLRTINDPQSQVLSGHADVVDGVSISEDGLRAVTCSQDKTVRLWDLSDKKSKTSILWTHEEFIIDVVISADGRWVVAKSLDGLARLWDFSKENALNESMLLSGHQGRVSAIAISPDSRWAVTGSSDKTARLWDLHSEDPSRASVVLRDNGLVGVLSFSPSGRWLGTSGYDLDARMWDLHAEYPAENPMIFDAHSQSVYALAFSEDEHWFLTGSQDATARLWDLTLDDPTSRSLVFRGHTTTLFGAAVSGAEQWAITSAGGETRMWDLDLESALSRAHRYAGRKLTDHERSDYVTD